MSHWRTARDQDEMHPDQQAELERLVEAELKAATARLAVLMQQVNQ